MLPYNRPSIRTRTIVKTWQVVFFLSLILEFNAFAGLQVTQLRCEYLENPLGIDVHQPRLSWILESSEREQKQTAYQILAASNVSELSKNHGDLWDSGKVLADQTTFVPYVGKPLMSREACFWKVRSWDKIGDVSRWSDVASWEMGLLAPSDWQAQWIARTTNKNEEPAPILRHKFTLNGKIKMARVYICGLGYYELHINGQKIGDRIRDPALTRYDRRDLYATYNVTPLLKRGTNAIGVILGNGWFNVQTRAGWGFDKASWRRSPRLLLSLVVQYADGRTMVIGSDGTWKTSTGPILFNSIYGGENYDARLEKPGWDEPDYDDSAWQAAEVVDAPKGKLVAEMMPPVEAIQIIKPVKLTEPKPGVFIFDMGQNFAGCTELAVKGPPGTKITLRHGEQLFPDGTLDTRAIDGFVKQMDTNQQFQTSTYILKGCGIERWYPRFTYYGFQYVEVTGFPVRPSLDSVRGIVMHSAVPAAGKFECSNPLLNRIQHATQWAYLSNLQGYPTDCPTREKNGWTGDAQLAAEQAVYNFMPAAVYAKWINDISDVQGPGGRVPVIVPTDGWGFGGCNPAWDSAIELIPFYLYEYYDDEKPLCDHYDNLKRYEDFLSSRATNDIISGGLGDWASFKAKTPEDITDTAYYYRDALIVSLAASLLGKTNDAMQYTQLAAKIKVAFNAKFYHNKTGTYGNGSQTSLSCALYFGLVEPENQARVLQNLLDNIRGKNGHIDAGVLGAKYLLNTLIDNGRAVAAYNIASQKDLPGWGWWMQQGATTLWESWNGGGSHNHIMFGDISAWFYKALAGINPDPAAPGFKHFIIRPQPVGDLTFATGEYDSIHGKIVSDWKIEKRQFHLRIVIPPNTTATLYVPNARLGDVREGDKLATNSDGIVSFSQKENAAVFEVESGQYHFTAPSQQPSVFNEYTEK